MSAMFGVLSLVAKPLPPAVSAVGLSHVGSSYPMFIPPSQAGHRNNLTKVTNEQRHTGSRRP